MAESNVAGKIELASDSQQSTTRSKAEIQAWMITHLEEALELDPGELRADESFDRYGLDSTEAVNLMSSLEDWLGVELEPNLPYEYPTIDELAEHLAAGGTGG